MRVQRLFYCTAVGIAMAAATTLVLGDSGTVAYGTAAAYRDRLASGIKEIEVAHARLQRQLDLLQSDAEAVRLAARELGYYRPGETVVNITDGTGRGAVAERGDSFDATYYTVGPLVHERVPRTHGGPKTLPMGLSFGALLFLVVAAAAALGGRRRSGERSRLGTHPDEPPLRPAPGDPWLAAIRRRGRRDPTRSDEEDWVARADATVRHRVREQQRERRGRRGRRERRGRQDGSESRPGEWTAPVRRIAGL